jgi:hypothetical protein
VFMGLGWAPAVRWARSSPRFLPKIAWHLVWPASRRASFARPGRACLVQVERPTGRTTWTSSARSGGLRCVMGSPHAGRASQSARVQGGTPWPPEAHRLGDKRLKGRRHDRYCESVITSRKTRPTVGVVFTRIYIAFVGVMVLLAGLFLLTRPRGETVSATVVRVYSPQFYTIRLVTRDGVVCETGLKDTPRAKTVKAGDTFEVHYPVISPCADVVRADNWFALYVPGLPLTLLLMGTILFVGVKHESRQIDRRLAQLRHKRGQGLSSDEAR